jgi:hypothetical protein
LGGWETTMNRRMIYHDICRIVAAIGLLEGISKLFKDNNEASKLG